MATSTEPLTNWAGNHRYGATELHRPRTAAQLCELAATAPSLQVLGSRHSFSAIGDAAALVSLEALPEAHAIAIDRRAMTVTVGGAVTYATLANALSTRPASRWPTSPPCPTSRSRARSPPRPTAPALAWATSPPRCGR